MNRQLPDGLGLSFAVGFLFTASFVGMWIAYAAGQMDNGGVIFISAVAVFAIPLFLGSIQVYFGRSAGFRFLKFGSLVLLILGPEKFFDVWGLEDSAAYREFQASRVASKYRRKWH